MPLQKRGKEEIIAIIITSKGCQVAIVAILAGVNIAYSPAQRAINYFSYIFAITLLYKVINIPR